jgi:hypothetical protein
VHGATVISCNATLLLAERKPDACFGLTYCRIQAACLDLSTGLSENRELTVPPLTPPYRRLNL